MAHLLGSNIDINVTDKRKTLDRGNANSNTRMASFIADAFVANAGGTTTTLVGANATPSTGANVIRPGEKFRLFTTAGVLKQETVFTITSVAVAASTTVTFTPAATGATASGDKARLVDSDFFSDEASLDAALTAFNSTSYSAARLLQMTQNDKIFAIRQHLDSDGI